MPPKKAKVAVAKTKKTGGKPRKHKNKVNKSKAKASKRTAQAKKRRDKYQKKKRKDRKKADKAKRTAKKTAAKKTKKTTKKKKKPAKKPAAPEKPEPPSDEDDEEEGSERKVQMKFTGISVHQMHDVRQKLTALTKSEFLEQIRNLTEHRSEEAKMQEAYLGSPESRMKLFCDDEKPTDSSAGPFQSHRFGAVFLLPGE